MKKNKVVEDGDMASLDEDGSTKEVDPGSVKVELPSLKAMEELVPVAKKP